MTRKKVKLAFISNDSARKATFKKRKKGLMKKVSELSTLCGIRACALIYSPYDPQPEVWPSPVGAQQVLSEFKRLPEMEQSKKMVNQDSFIRQRITKAHELLKKMRKDNREKEVTQFMFHCLTGGGNYLNLNIMDMNDLVWIIDQFIKDIKKRVETLTKGDSDPSSSSRTVIAGSSSSPSPIVIAPPPPPPLPPQAVNVIDNMELKQQQQWLMDFITSNTTTTHNNNDHNIENYSIQKHQQPGQNADVGSFGGANEDMILPFAGDNNSNIINHNSALWSNAFFP